MVNGFDRNWVRASAAMEGFRARYGRWLTRLRLFPQALEELKNHVSSEESFGMLSEKLALVPDKKAPMVAKDEDGNAYGYGAEGFPRERPQVQVHDWLGIVPDGRCRSECPF